MLNTAYSVEKCLTLTFQQLHEVHDPSSLTTTNNLKYKLSEIEHVWLPFFLKMITAYIVTEPSFIIQILQQIKDNLMTSPYIMNLLSLDDEINSLRAVCKEILRSAHIYCRKVIQSVQRIFYEKNYDKLVETVEEFINNYPLFNVAQNVVTMVKNIIPHCTDNLLHSMVIDCEGLQMKTADYHPITTLTLPFIKLYTRLHKQITTSLQKGSSDIEMTYHYIRSGKFDEEFELVRTNRLIKLQEVASHFVNHQASRQ